MHVPLHFSGLHHHLMSRETTEEYGEELVKLCGVIQNVLSLTLGLDEGFLHREFGEAGAGLRVNYYPKCPQPDLTLGLSPHSDPGGLTILLTDDQVKGLQVRKGGSWITVEPIPDAFVVNVGDQIQVCFLLYGSCFCLDPFSSACTSMCV